MAWQIKPFSHRCLLTGEPFADGRRYVSWLVQEDDGELRRYDISAEKEAEFAPTGEVVCRWRQIYKKAPECKTPDQKQKETAEGLFFSLFENDPAESEPPAENDGMDNAATAPKDEAASTATSENPEAMKKFLALLLERKRILRPRGISPDGKFRIMEHARSRSIFMVPAGDLRQEEIMEITGRLAELVK